MTELISEYGLLLRNIGKEYTYDCQLGKSGIDFTLTCNLGEGIQDWKVSLALNFSNHNTISLNIAKEILELPATRPRAKADWDPFEKELVEHNWKPSKYFTGKKINQWVDRLRRVLTCTGSPPLHHPGSGIGKKKEAMRRCLRSCTGIETLRKRSSRRCDVFLRKALANPRFGTRWFKPRLDCNRTLRMRRTFQEPRARSLRKFRSPLPFMVRIANEMQLHPEP